MNFAFVFIGVVFLVLGSVVVYTSVRVVPEGELEALYVLGRMEGILEPGRNIVPPLVSKTYPIDPRTETIARGDERIEIPSAFEDEVRDAANALEDGPEGVPAGETENGTGSSRVVSMYQRVVTLIGKGLFLAGMVGLTVTWIKFLNLLGSSYGDVSWPFVEPTFAHLAVATVVSFFLIAIGEPIENMGGDERDTEATDE